MKKLILIVILFFNLISQSACANSKKLIVLLDWFANPNHAPLFVAKEKGFFQEQGLDVELLSPADPADPIKLVLAGKADIAITYEPQLIQQIDQGLPLIRIGTLINQPLACVTVLKNGTISQLSQLKGKKIGYSSPDADSILLKTMLEKNGISLQDVERINVHYNLTQALLSHQVDAVTGIMRNVELIQMELAGQPGRAFLPEQNGVPVYSELIFVIHKNQQQDKRFLPFLFALQKGVDYLKKNPDSTWHDFAKLHPELDNELNHRIWLNTLPYFSSHPAQFNVKQWLLFLDFMKKNKSIKNIFPIQHYAIDLTKV